VTEHKYKSYIVQTENRHWVRQWHFTSKTLWGALGISVILVGTLLFFSAEFLTQRLYQSKIRDIRQEYSSLSITLTELQNRLGEMNNDIDRIEEKDKAVRTYANLPDIDKDIRRLGIGGMRLDRSNRNIETRSAIKSKISSIEMDVDQLSRKVKLELASYETIYDHVQGNSNRMRHIPSLRPVLSGYLNSGFGYRRDPMDFTRRFHYGQDITVSRGAPVIAPADGVVKQARYRGGNGKYIKIDHGNGYSTLYLHLSKIQVKKGQSVERGDIIGKTGNTGRSTAPHLHYEVHYYGTPQNPLDYFFSGVVN